MMKSTFLVSSVPRRWTFPRNKGGQAALPVRTERVLLGEGAGWGSGSTPIPPSCMLLQGDEGVEARFSFSIFLKWFRVLSCTPMKDSAVSKASLSPQEQLFYKVKKRELCSARSRCSEANLI